MRSVIIITLLLVTYPLTVFAVDEPPYKVVLKDGDFEVRQYQSLLIAEVVETGSMRRAGNRGFRVLADFIFGNNKPAEKIEMTAPVTRTPSTKIKMTAPVTRTENEDNSWTIAFVMPEKWTKESLPMPSNADIVIREVPSELIASVKFSGKGSEVSHNEKQILLEQWISQQAYKITGDARFAAYDAPWVLWPLRRNEVMIPVAKISQSVK